LHTSSSTLQHESREIYPSCNSTLTPSDHFPPSSQNFSKNKPTCSNIFSYEPQLSRNHTISILTNRNDTLHLLWTKQKIPAPILRTRSKQISAQLPLHYSWLHHQECHLSIPPQSNQHLLPIPLQPRFPLNQHTLYYNNQIKQKASNKTNPFLHLSYLPNLTRTIQNSLHYLSRTHPAQPLYLFVIAFPFQTPNSTLHILRQYLATPNHPNSRSIIQHNTWSNIPSHLPLTTALHSHRTEQILVKPTHNTAHVFYLKRKRSEPSKLP
jgi:hypothetical protein